MANGNIPRPRSDEHHEPYSEGILDEALEINEMVDRVEPGVTRSFAAQEAIRSILVNMNSEKAVEQTKPIESDPTVSLNNFEALDNPEFKKKVEEARLVLAKQYEQYGAKPEDFNLVTSAKDGKTVYTVAYTAPNGLDLGDPDQSSDERRSYNSIMSDENKQAHQVEIDGIIYDTRAGMTLDTYKAFIKAMRQTGELPDSGENKFTVGDKDYYTWTLLTGESGRTSGAGIARANDDGSVNWAWANRSMDFCNIRFRPAIELQL